MKSKLTYEEKLERHREYGRRSAAKRKLKEIYHPELMKRPYIPFNKKPVKE